MFSRLFSESGLSLDRLRALVEVGAFGSIVRAAEGDLARQSQYSRQIKELEDFFRVPLAERQGKGLRLTASGKELARISRFFLLGLSNFQRGCLAEGQSYRIGAGATFASVFLLPLLAGTAEARRGVRFRVETVDGDDVERRLHELTLDFGVVTRAAVSRPLQIRELGCWRLRLWTPRRVSRSLADTERLWKSRQLPLAWPMKELAPRDVLGTADFEPELACETFLEARTALAGGHLAALLPDFLEPAGDRKAYQVTELPQLAPLTYRLAWNPRLLRLNPHAARRRDLLVRCLAAVGETATEGSSGSKSKPRRGVEDPSDQP